MFQCERGEAPGCIYGYTCVNDVTAVDIINKDTAFPQWTRAKSFDTFGAFGPAIATDLDPMALRVRTVLNGEERQNYVVSDMFFPPYKLVSLLSRDMTLLPGDVIVVELPWEYRWDGNAQQSVRAVIFALSGDQRRISQ